MKQELFDIRQSTLFNRTNNFKTEYGFDDNKTIPIKVPKQNLTVSLACRPRLLRCCRCCRSRRWCSPWWSSRLRQRCSSWVVATWFQRPQRSRPTSRRPWASPQKMATRAHTTATTTTKESTSLRVNLFLYLAMNLGFESSKHNVISMRYHFFISCESQGFT